MLALATGALTSLVITVAIYGTLSLALEAAEITIRDVISEGIAFGLVMTVVSVTVGRRLQQRLGERWAATSIPRLTSIPIQ